MLSYPDIYIPSRGRANNLITPYTLPPRLQERCYVVVRSEEAAEYVAADDERMFGFITMPRSFRGGLSETRQWIFDNHGQGMFHIQLDDDITSFNFKPDMSRFGGLVRATPRQISSGFDTLLKQLLDGVAHVGMCNRLAAAGAKVAWRENAHIQQTLFYRADILRREKIRFDRVRLMQDLDVNLQLLQRGYPNKVCTKFSFNARDYRTSGGCQAYRDDALVKHVGGQMELLHPDITRLTPNRKRDGWHMNTNFRRAYIAKTKQL